MAIQNCKRCGSLYNKISKDICSNCLEQEEKDYKKVRLYLKRHKTVDIKDVSHDTEVDIELIYQFLQEGRISLGEGRSSGYPCKNCGTLIHSGSLCTDCSDDLHSLKKSLKAVSTSQTKEPEEVVVEKRKKSAFYTKE